MRQSERRRCVRFITDPHAKPVNCPERPIAPAGQPQSCGLAANSLITHNGHSSSVPVLGPTEDVSHHDELAQLQAAVEDAQRPLTQDEPSE